MKLFSKRDSSVPEAPQDMYASQAAERDWPAPTPAPAGALQRHYADTYAPDEDIDEPEEEAPYRRGARVRLRGALRTVTGRVVVGTAAFLILAALATGALLVRNAVLHDERFVVSSSEQIEITGNTHMTRGELLSVFGEDVERNIFKVPLAQRRADLERLPWVEHATVMRLLPNTLRISVVERTPVAFARQGTAIGLVDAGGVLLDMPSDSTHAAHYSFPVLTGLSSQDPLSTRAARMEIYRRFIHELDSSGQKVSETLSEVDISSPEDVKALIPSGSTDILVHFGDDQFLDRYRHFEQHLPEWKGQYPNLASADMRYDRQVVLEMVPGTELPAPEAVAANNGDTLSPAATAANRNADDHKAAPTPAAPALKPSAPERAAERPQRPPARPVSAGRISAANAKVFAALAAASKHAADSGQGPQ